MSELRVAVGIISLRLRHSQSLKDKRKVVQSIVQKLRNQGFSVTEVDQLDSPKFASIGLCYAAKGAGEADNLLKAIDKLLIGDFEVLDFNKDIIDYSGESESLFSASEEEWDPRE